MVRGKDEADVTRNTSSRADAEAQQSEADTYPPAYAGQEQQRPAGEALPEGDLGSRGSEPRTAEAAGEPGKTTIKLAHPLTSDEDLRRLGLEAKEGGYGVGESVTVRTDDARTLINAGYAQVDPEDTRAVSDTLRGDENR